jgi:hypothetical protein
MRKEWVENYLTTHKNNIKENESKMLSRCLAYWLTCYGSKWIFVITRNVASMPSKILFSLTLLRRVSVEGSNFFQSKTHFSLSYTHLLAVHWGVKFSSSWLCGFVSTPWFFLISLSLRFYSNGWILLNKKN